MYYLLATPLFVVSEGALLAVRLLSVVLGSGVIIVAYYIAKTLFPHRTIIGYGTAAFVAFVPMHVAILASVNNDMVD